MSTPEPPDEPEAKQDPRITIRIGRENHRKLAAVAATFGGTLNQAVSLLFDRAVLRVVVGHERRDRWDAAAKAAGMSTSEFVVAHMEAVLMAGADPGILRRVHDMTAALCRAADIIPSQTSTPGADRQVIRDTPRQARSTP